MKSLGRKPQARLERIKASPLWASDSFRNLHPILPGLRDPTAAMPTIGEFIRGCYEESLVLSEELGDALRLSNVLGSLAILHGSEGEFDAAETLFEKSLALSRKQGNPNNIAANLCNLAIVSARRGMVERARARLREALAIAQDIGSKALGLAILGIAAVVAATGGEWTRAVRHHGASQAESRRQGFDARREDEILAPLIAQARAALGDDAFVTEENAGLARSYDEAMADVRAWLATAQ
jgi:tetratricopeptide (TPR) repeat protein